MILNVSSRTDIPAFYSEWFMNRYEEGFVEVRNPFNPEQIKKIYFDEVDAIMFCSKNPIPLIPHLKKIKQPILFHITLTPYKKDIEPNVIDKRKIIKSIKELSKILGPDYVYVRYDPIFLNETYTIEYHLKAFKKMCEHLNGYINTIIISFIDPYKNVIKNQNILRIKPFTKEDYKTIGIEFSKIAKENKMTVQTCFEEENLVEYGFKKGVCFSLDLAFKLTGKTNFKKGQVRGKNKCECVKTVDIGAYNSCPHFCKYCYANYDEKMVKRNYLNHDKTSSFLIKM